MRYHAPVLSPLAADWLFPSDEDCEPLPIDYRDRILLLHFVSQALDGERMEWKDVNWRRMGYAADLYRPREAEFGLDPESSAWCATATIGEREVVFSCWQAERRVLRLRAQAHRRALHRPIYSGRMQ